ncbi:Thiamin pyrophosphokinase [Rhizoclosmatium globosum]|uniref:Thiamine pyrophosphokinase n=1 Tax=Rhizoclosmatium globosum TaxID=329046 RepID=A0A1Y2CYS5_9FUNG|nr:Thiamin pyrophosphokinase [Rhizoclosmatium globosum]|eukprot:ORY52036.1 Thiamin pyrophosphokinase [Rhizoclosmatium globosum]
MTTSTVTSWNISTYLLPPNPGTETDDAPAKVALIMLNQPLCAPRHLQNLWSHASIRLCADGGANRLYDLFTTDQERLKFLPDVIRGDLDSVRPEVKDWYASQGVPVVKVACEYSTDFGKCVAHIEEVEEANGGVRHEIVALGALGGRLDQTLSSVFMLYQLQKKDTEQGKERRKVYLMSNESIAVLLNPENKHQITCDMSFEGPTCGLIPVSGTALVESSGLKWNLDHSMPMSFHSMISTSNWFADGDEKIKVVELATDAPIVWTVEVTLAK